MHPRLLTIVVAALAVPSLAGAAGTSPDYGNPPGYGPPDSGGSPGYGSPDSGPGYDQPRPDDAQPGYGGPPDGGAAPGYGGTGGYDGSPGSGGAGGYGASPDYGGSGGYGASPDYGGTPGYGGAGGAPGTGEPGYPQPGPDGRPMGRVLTDAQIVGVLHVVNQGEVAAGQQAQRKAEDPEVRSLANRMVAEHAALDERLLALARQLGVSPEPSKFTAKMVAIQQHVQGELERFSGPAYDVAYTDIQLAGHGGLVALLDFLGTQATSPELKAAIDATRPLVLSQLEQATAVREMLPNL